MRRNESFLSLARLTYSGMRSTGPISRSMLSAASLAPPCAGPHRQAQPAAEQADGVAPAGPASATRAGEAHGRSRGVLVVIGVQNEDAVHGPRQHRGGLVVFAWHRVAHAQ